MSIARFGMFAAVAVLCSSIAPGHAQAPSEQEQKAVVDFFEIDKDITLRRMVVHNPRPKGTVLFLHGFPETLYAWKDISLALADDYEVHAFDWPGYGLSSRPTVDRFSYAPKDYAHVLDEYIGKAGINRSKLTIYATDIGALPALLLALEKPDIAKSIIVGDFAPFQQTLLHVREPEEPEGGTFDGPGPRPAEQESRRYSRKRLQKRFA